MKKEILILRTHECNKHIMSICDKLSRIENIDFCIVVDETNGKVEFPEKFSKCEMDREFILSSGLSYAEKTGWMCGDYFLYAAYLKNSNYDNYWLIEPDVFISFSRLEDFFHIFKSDLSTDFISAGYGIAHEEWAWYPAMSKLIKPVHFCLFPIIRASNRAIKFLMEKRRELANSNPNLDLLAYPNDESFCATTLAENSFVCRNINSYGYELVRQDTFGIILGHPYNYLLSKASDQCIYHPAVSHPALFYKYQHIIESQPDDYFLRLISYFPHSCLDIESHHYKIIEGLIKSRLDNMDK